MLNLAIYAAAFLLMAAGFVLAEHMLKGREQPALRPDSASDLLHVLLSNSAPSALVRALGYWSLATISAGQTFALMSPRPLFVQVLVILLLTDLSFYFVHRLLHQVPVLWRLHRMHHTPAQMDWLSGYRKHALETVLHSAVAFLPVALLGFAPEAWLVFGLIGTFFAGFTHLNVAAELRWLEPLVVTPRYHAWHHASTLDEQGHNLAGKLSVFDRVFGTRRPESKKAWPETLGLDELTATTWWPRPGSRRGRAERNSYEPH